MRGRGFEPPRLMQALAPQASVYTSFTTRAHKCFPTIAKASSIFNLFRFKEITPLL